MAMGTTRNETCSPTMLRSREADVVLFPDCVATRKAIAAREGGGAGWPAWSHALRAESLLHANVRRSHRAEGGMYVTVVRVPIRRKLAASPSFA